MITKSTNAAPIWISTDCEGEIQDISRGACDLLGIRARGQKLSVFFPIEAKQLAFDMEVALTGWPSRRMATLKPSVRRQLVVEYFVSARVTADSVALYWFFDLIAVGNGELVH